MEDDDSRSADIGRRFKDLRKRKGWTLDALAERSGLNRSELVRVESGFHKLTTTRIREALAQGFELSPQNIDRFIAGELTVNDALGEMGEVKEEPLVPRNNLEKCLDYWGDTFKASVVKAYRTEWKGREDEREPAEHGAELVERQRAANERLFKVTAPDAVEPAPKKTKAS